MSIEDKITFNEPLGYWGACSKDAENTSRAASGGVFWELAKATIECGGVVFGSVLEDDGTCHHTMASTLDDLIPMQGSKYVWSSIDKCYEQCVKALTSGKKVLFTGTPCQIAGLQAYLNKESLKVQGVSELRENLITVDLFCHGTPPQELFKAYIEWLSKKHKTDDGIHNYTFRSKLKGWGPALYYYYYYYTNSKKIEESGYANSDPYYSAFLKSSILQKKCYNCKYARKDRLSDITIGDFWGIENHFPNFLKQHGQEGISAILINTDKGETTFGKIKEKFYLAQADFEKIKQPVIESYDNKIILKTYRKLRNQIVENLDINNIDYIFNKLLHVKKDLLRPFKIVAKKIIPNKIIKILRRR